MRVINRFFEFVFLTFIGITLESIYNDKLLSPTILSGNGWDNISMPVNFDPKSPDWNETFNDDKIDKRSKVRKKSVAHRYPPYFRKVFQEDDNTYRRKSEENFNEKINSLIKKTKDLVLNKEYPENDPDDLMRDEEPTVAEEVYQTFKNLRDDEKNKFISMIMQDLSLPETMDIKYASPENVFPVPLELEITTLAYSSKEMISDQYLTPKIEVASATAEFASVATEFASVTTKFACSPPSVFECLNLFPNMTMPVSATEKLTTKSVIDSSKKIIKNQHNMNKIQAISSINSNNTNPGCVCDTKLLNFVIYNTVIFVAGISVCFALFYTFSKRYLQWDQVK